MIGDQPQLDGVGLEDSLNSRWAPGTLAFAYTTTTLTRTSYR